MQHELLIRVFDLPYIQTGFFIMHDHVVEEVSLLDHSSARCSCLYYVQRKNVGPRVQCQLPRFLCRCGTVSCYSYKGEIGKGMIRVWLAFAVFTHKRLR